ncbi:MAG: Gfo/Idh/MocA family oxidoreductase [Okeania sp. SIO2H7]|nr:Gfo/Idh/MocA family oxidoreductase [Okeania sp. SIO2H7]
MHLAGTEFGQQFGDVKGFDSWQDLIAWSGVDAIYIATPTALKEEIAVVAAQQKKHVLVDKPFATLESLQNITVACRENQVLFMDATHFVHHPRTAAIKQTMEETIGQVQAMRSAFYFPLSDRSNIRFNPELEPKGALGDLGWYNMRATVEFLAPNINLSQISVISCPVASFVYNRGGRKIIARSDIATQRYRDRYSSST